MCGKVTQFKYLSFSFRAGWTNDVPMSFPVLAAISGKIRRSLCWTKCIFDHVVVFARFETYIQLHFASTLCSHILTVGFQKPDVISYDRQQIWSYVTSAACCCIRGVWNNRSNMWQQFGKWKRVNTFWCNIKHPENDFRIDWCCIKNPVKKHRFSVKIRPNPETVSGFIDAASMCA